MLGQNGPPVNTFLSRCLNLPIWEPKRFLRGLPTRDLTPFGICTMSLARNPAAYDGHIAKSHMQAHGRMLRAHGNPRFTCLPAVICQGYAIAQRFGRVAIAYHQGLSDILTSAKTGATTRPKPDSMLN